MARITVGHESLGTFPGGGGDQHVVLYFYEPGVEPPPTLAAARARFGQVRPAMRSYTVRRFDRDAGELDLDFVLHGTGPAATWADHARAGDDLILVGPSPAYLPDPEVSRHVLVGDESALPAVAALLAEVPDATAVLEVADAAEEQDLPGDVRWLHRDGIQPGTSDLLLATLREIAPAGRDVAVWAAGERTAMHAVRGYLLDECHLDRRQVRTTMYWRHGQAGTGTSGG
jgi:NADPH-dependent ferric siderophore reductase